MFDDSRDPYDAEDDRDSEERFLVACLKDCFCCDQCATQRPCAGTMAGGLCDRMCFCPSDDEDFDTDGDIDF